MAESLRVLILEDNPADTELVQFELEEAGFAFIAKVVVTEEDYVSALQDFSPDLILSDYDLPKYDGASALVEAKRKCPDTPFILVTGAVTEDRAIDILTQGAKDYVLKSRLEQRLVPAVRRALAEAEEHRSRKQAQEELKAASLYSRSLIESSLDPLVMISPEGKVTDVNKATEEITGVTREQIIGSDFSDYFTEPEKARAGYKKVFSQGSVRDYPLAVRHITGHITEVLYNATVYENGKGEVQGVFAAAHDVTGLKKVEEELREAYRRLNEKDKIRTEERQAEIEARKKVEEALREKAAQDTAHNAELRLRAQERLKVIKGHSGPPKLGADEQKLLHELQIYQIELEMQNEDLKRYKDKTDVLMAKYLEIYDFAPIGHATLNPQGNILRVNLTAAALLGVERSLLIGQRFQLHVSREYYPAFIAFFRRTFESEIIESCEVMLLKEERESRLVRLQARSSEDRKECNLAIIDITDIKRTEDEGPERTR
jgi:PAS domain S-box-containing protein